MEKASNQLMKLNSLILTMQHIGLLKKTSEKELLNSNKEMAKYKGDFEQVSIERDAFEAQLIKVKTDWANSELELAQRRMNQVEEEY